MLKTAPLSLCQAREGSNFTDFLLSDAAEPSSGWPSARKSAQLVLQPLRTVGSTGTASEPIAQFSRLFKILSYRCFVKPGLFWAGFKPYKAKNKNRIRYLFLNFGLDSVSTNFFKICGGAKMTIFKKVLIWTVPLKMSYLKNKTFQSSHPGKNYWLFFTYDHFIIFFLFLCDIGTLVDFLV